MRSTAVQLHGYHMSERPLAARWSHDRWLQHMRHYPKYAEMPVDGEMVYLGSGEYATMAVERATK